MQDRDLEEPVPLDPWVAEELRTWKRAAPYNQPEDWVFASTRKWGNAALQSGLDPHAVVSSRCEEGEDRQAHRLAHLPAYLLDLAEG